MTFLQIVSGVTVSLAAAHVLVWLVSWVVAAFRVFVLGDESGKEELEREELLQSLPRMMADLRSQRAEIETLKSKLALLAAPSAKVFAGKLPRQGRKIRLLKCRIGCVSERLDRAAGAPAAKNAGSGEGEE